MASSVWRQFTSRLCQTLSAGVSQHRSGEVVAHPRRYRKAERQLAKPQRRGARRKQGSHRRRKAIALLKRKQRAIARQRQDCHQQTALMLLRHDDLLDLEDVPVRTVVRNPQLAKSMRDASWGGVPHHPHKPRQHGPDVR